MKFLAPIFAILISVLSGNCQAQTVQSGDGMPLRQSLDDAWWTGPLLAANAGTLPQGHFLFEPYFFDSKPFKHLDAQGHSHPAADANEFGSFSYLLYGLADDFTVGLIPRFGYDDAGSGKSSSSLNLGDWTLQGQYQLAQFHEGDWIPTISLNVGETFPIGNFDKLNRPSDGFGAGTYTTILSVYSQTFFWLPNGRAVRTRLNLSYALASGVGLRDASVYGTSYGFLGHARPSSAMYGDLAFEYSLSRNWVAAIDFWLEQDGNVRVEGAYPSTAAGRLTPSVMNSGVSQSFFLAPAVEYNWSSTLGIIVGARIFAAGRNATALVTPVFAINYVR